MLFSSLFIATDYAYFYPTKWVAQITPGTAPTSTHPTAVVTVGVEVPTDGRGIVSYSFLALAFLLLAILFLLSRCLLGGC